MRNIVLRNTQCPGDWVVLTAAIRELHKAYPGQFKTGIDVGETHLFQHNPYVDFSLRKGSPDSQVVVAKYPMVHQSNQNRIHFMQAYIEYLNTQLKVKVSLTEFRPDLYLTDAEKAKPPHGVKKPYWVFASGGKRDYSAKWWDTDRWQTVIESMSKWVTLVQVGGRGSNNDHVHPKLNNTINLVQQTTFRELMQLIYHSEGVMCVVTCLMHIAAAFNKPCVVVAGGREPYYWEAYTKESRLACMKRHNPSWEPPVEDSFVPHRFLHTVGTGTNPIAVLPCCRNGGCWKSRIGPKDLRAHYSICTDQVQLPKKYLPHCLDLITPDHVLSAVESYYADGYLKKNASVEVREIPVPTPAAMSEIVAEDTSAVPLAVPVIPTEPPKTLQSCGALAKRLGCGFLWINDPFTKRPRDPEMEHKWQRQVHALAASEGPCGLVYWTIVTEDLRNWVRDHFPNAQPFGKHPMDPKLEIVYYPRKGFLCMPPGSVGVVDWEDTSEDFELHIGATLHALGVGLKDAGHLIRGI